MPPVLSEQELALRRKNRDALLQVAMRVVGVISALIIAGGIGVVIYKKVQNRPALEWDYVNKIYGKDHQHIPGSSESAPVTVTRAPETKSHFDENSIVDMSRHDRPIQARPSDMVDVSSIGRAEAGVRNLESNKEAICQAVKEFFEAKNITELLPLVRDARRVRPLMEDYYSRMPIERHRWLGAGTLRQVDEPGYRFVYAEARLEGVPPTYVLVEETDVGFLVDWESAVRYSEADWKQFLVQRPSRPTLMRLIASKPGSDDLPPNDGVGGRMVLKLQHPEEPGIAYGIFDPADPQMRALLEQLTACQWRDAPVTIRIAFPTDAGLSNRVDISSAEGKGWLVLKNPSRS